MSRENIEYIEKTTRQGTAVVVRCRTMFRHAQNKQGTKVRETPEYSWLCEEPNGVLEFKYTGNIAVFESKEEAEETVSRMPDDEIPDDVFFDYDPGP